VRSRQNSVLITGFVAAALVGTVSNASRALADDNSAPAPAPADITSFQQTLQQQQKLLESQQRQLNDAHRKLNDQLKELKAQEQALQQQQQQITALRTAVAGPRLATGTGTAPSAQPIQAGFAPQQQPIPTLRDQSIIPAIQIRRQQTTQAPGDTGQGSTPPNAAPEQEQRPEIADVSLASQGGVLTPKGVFSFEPTYQYQYTSGNQIVIQGLTVIPGITIGSQNVRSLVDRQQTVTLGGRLGITDRLEVEVEVPYVYRDDDTTVQPLSASPNGTVAGTHASGHDIGDVEFGAHYQINSGGDGWPYFVANILAKSDTGSSPFSEPVDFNTGIPTKLNTGTGFWAFQPSVTAILPSDPVVFFANARYIYNVAKDVTIQPTAITNPVATRANVQPGNGFGLSFGMGFGINDKSSFSLAYSQTYLDSTSQNGLTIQGSSVDIGSFNLGFAYQLTQRTSINLGIAIGTTKASPDAAITLKIPVKFQVF
jgi:TolA-binding protein